jgi:hypothetical protein
MHVRTRRARLNDSMKAIRSRPYPRAYVQDVKVSPDLLRFGIQNFCSAPLVLPCSCVDMIFNETSWRSDEAWRRTRILSCSPLPKAPSAIAVPNCQSKNQFIGYANGRCKMLNAAYLRREIIITRGKVLCAPSVLQSWTDGTRAVPHRAFLGGSGARRKVHTNCSGHVHL